MTVILLIFLNLLTLLSNALKIFRELYPKLKIDFVRPDDTINLLPRKFDVCISTAPVRMSGLHSVVLYSEELVLLLPVSHPLAHLKSIDLHELHDENFIFPTPGSPTRIACETLCYHAGFVPNIAASTNNMTSISTYIQAGMGIAIVPFFGIGTSPKNISVLRISRPNPLREITISRPTDRHNTPASDSFYNFMIDYFRSTQL